MRRVYKNSRVIFALFFFIPLFSFFIDFTGLINDQVKSTFTFLQFVPSIIKFFTVTGIAAAGFLIVIMLTLVSGRIYCSVICPLGVLQDIASYLRKKIKSRIRFDYTSPKNYLRYGLLFLTIVTAASGSLIVVNILDPFSGFGRVSFQLIRPVAVALNNGLSFTLSRFGNYSVYPQEFYPGDLWIVAFSFVFLVIVIFLAVTRGRLYCNTICPVGALLGLLSKFSIYKFKIKESLCTDCGACGKVCKSECIDTANHEVDMSRCVVCFNCTTICTSSAVVLERGKRSTGEKYDPSRRIFINKLGSFFPMALGLTAIGDTIRVYVMNKIPVVKKNPVTPPGSTGSEHFTSRCTACGLCVSSCPTHVIQPSFTAYGLAGFLQPEMDFSRSFCTYDCNLCTLVCPTGALLPLEMKTKQLLQLGVAKFVKDNCVVVTQKTECGACSEHCPTKAVTMVPYQNLLLPEVREKYCVGCGACEKACPTKPYKAIYVEGHTVHKKAEINKEKQGQKKEKVLEEFPF